jgi:flagellar protein FlbD
MIRLTRLNHVPMMLNADLIEHLEVTPDTIITLTTGQKFMVLESADEVLDRVIEFRRAVSARMCQCPTLLRQEEEEEQAAGGQL